VCQAEGVAVEDEALGMIASAAEGSARDGLSILDQAIAHADMEGGGEVTAAKVREMLGLADKGAQRAVFASLLDGQPQAMLAAVDDQYALGVEPLALMRGAMELTHRITVAQLGTAGESVGAMSEDERAAIASWAERLSPGQVHRLWQLLLKGHDEVRSAPDPLIAAQMALLRVMHAADMPDPGKLEKLLTEAAARGVGSVSGTVPSAGGPTASMPAPEIEWSILCDRVEQEGLLRVGQMMRDYVRVIELRHGHLRFTTPAAFTVDIVPELRDALLRATAERWDVARGEGEGAPSLREREEAAALAEAERVRNHPLVQAALATFPKAELLEMDGQAAPNWSKRA
jgi:DNA polymerase-3 subunit gamma/tau